MLLKFTHWIIIHVLRLSPDSPLGGAAAFFVYDSLKIIFLLVFMIFIIALIRSFIPHRVIKGWMSAKGGAGYVLAALFGAVTPFCSCSSIPIFIAFLKARVPLGILFSFLITSPLINEYLVVLMIGFFGWKITAAYVVSGLMIGIVAGMVLARMGLERYLEKDVVLPELESASQEERTFECFSERSHFAWIEAFSILKKIWVWVIVGVAMGAVIHNYVPQKMVDVVISSTGIFSVPLAVIIGVPMYGSCAAIVPVAVVLFQKGLPLGTALAFMMAIAALSLPEAVMLRRVMKMPLIAAFFGITTAGIIVIGYLLNFAQPYLLNPRG